ncbi:MAG TPA: GTP pyrophosphokinase [Thermoanaerobaculia bacterium]|nr:GTP pyrophosphokinase [Thermoanaerobaculia bacterium]
MNKLEEAILIAVQAHAGVTDKGGAPYILHPLRVMLKMREEPERIVAVLHDVVEDTDWTFAALREKGFSEVVVTAIDHLTRRPEETYEEFVERAARHPIARAVKIADVEDNLDLSRIATPTEKDHARRARYERALERLRRQESA